MGVRTLSSKVTPQRPLWRPFLTWSHCLSPWAGYGLPWAHPAPLPRWVRPVVSGMAEGHTPCAHMSSCHLCPRVSPVSRDGPAGAVTQTNPRVKPAKKLKEILAKTARKESKSKQKQSGG